MSNKKIYIRTFGCQMNVRDSEVICGLLRAANYKLTYDPTEADVIILNTCSVRQHAEEKVWSEIGKYKNRKPIIGVIGCMAQNYKDEIFRRAPSVDFVVGTSDIDKIPGIIDKLIHGNGMFERKIWETDGEIRPEEIYHAGYYQDKDHAYVVISEGCLNFCSYCVVPYVRGPLRNREPKKIVKEIEGAIDKGITKITLLGQNVNAYQAAVDFPQLLRMINKVEGLKEFTFLTSHPKDTSVELFKTMAQLEKLKKSLHLPVQSGSDRILKLMNRGYTRKFYLDLAVNYRKIVEGGALSTDIIVGFPTETKDDFQGTYDLVKEVEFDSAFIFKYSTRPHTEAAKMVDDVPREDKEKRHKVTLDLQKSISGRKKNDKKN